MQCEELVAAFDKQNPFPSLTTASSDNRSSMSQHSGGGSSLKTQVCSIINDPSSTHIGRVNWTHSDVQNLEEGIRKFGTKWSDIFRAFDFSPGLSPAKLCTRYHNKMRDQTRSP